jgi:hypothetical protein
MVSLWLEPPHCPEALVRRCSQATPLRGVDGHFDFVPLCLSQRRPGRTWRCAAIRNMNLMLGFPETAAFEQVALFP